MRSPHAARQLFLRQPGMRARRNQRRGQLVFLLAGGMRGAVFRILAQPAGLQIIKFYATARARCSATSIARRGVFWVFLTKACTMTTRRPPAVT